MTQKEMIVIMLGDIVSDVNDYFYNDETDEVWYWDGDYKVCTPFNDFVELAFDKWRGNDCGKTSSRDRVNGLF